MRLTGHLLRAGQRRPADKLGPAIGRLSDDVMAEITRRLAFWLGIA